MAVYTGIAAADVGAVRSCKGLAEGVENSNDPLVTARGSYFVNPFSNAPALPSGLSRSLPSSLPI